MELLRDDPIIACMMRTGYPPWMQYDDDNYVMDDENGEIEWEDDEDG